MKVLLGIMRVIGLLWCGITAALTTPDVSHFEHDFWLPRFHKQRLSYCFSDQKTCGKPVADRYCQNLGYDRAERETIYYNVGMTSYLDQKKCCRGWRCHGFKLIRCSARALHRPTRNYYYRSKKFVLPRVSQYRLDWCYEQGKGCGKRAAYSFCRHMGYEKTTHYVPETHLAATRSLGNQKLCFTDCKGFASITCYR